MPKKKRAGKKMATKRVAQMKVGAGIAAGIAGALAGAYLLYARTKPQQKKTKAWVVKARKDAAMQAKQLAHIGENEYRRIVEKSMKHYGAMNRIGATEVAAAVRDAKSEWKHIQMQAKKAAGPVVRRRPAKKATKRRAKKKK